jgi:hypothetical protein
LFEEGVDFVDVGFEVVFALLSELGVLLASYQIVILYIPPSLHSSPILFSHLIFEGGLFLSKESSSVSAYAYNL